MIHVSIHTQKFGFVHCYVFQLANFEARGALGTQLAAMLIWRIYALAAVVSVEAVTHCWIHFPSFAMKQKKSAVEDGEKQFCLAKSRPRFEI